MKNPSSKNNSSKSFNIKIIPTQKEKEYFHATFVFDGNKAPEMSVVEISEGASIIPYQEWKDTIKALVILSLAIIISIIFALLFVSFLEFVYSKKTHNSAIKKFRHHIEKMKKEGLLETTTDIEENTAVKIYESF
ncbi:hypothetical protein ACT51I_19330 [Pseudomonas aeruginosa]